MSTLKIIYFDSIGIEPLSFENKLRNLCSSIYTIKEGLIIVNYKDTAHNLFNQIVASDNRYNILIVDLDTSSDSYWGFMSKDLWKWFQENK